MRLGDIIPNVFMAIAFLLVLSMFARLAVEVWMLPFGSLYE